MMNKLIFLFLVLMILSSCNYASQNPPRAGAGESNANMPTAEVTSLPTEVKDYTYSIDLNPTEKLSFISKDGMIVSTDEYTGSKEMLTEAKNAFLEQNPDIKDATVSAIDIKTESGATNSIFIISTEGQNYLVLSKNESPKTKLTYLDYVNDKTSDFYFANLDDQTLDTTGEGAWVIKIDENNSIYTVFVNKGTNDKPDMYLTFASKNKDGVKLNENSAKEIHARIRKAENKIFAEAQEFLGSGFEVKPDGTVFDTTNNKEVPGLIIVPFDENTMISREEVDWGWKRVYEFKDKKDFTVTGTNEDIKVLDNSGLDMYAWVYEGGEFKRQKLEFNGPNNTKVYREVESPQESDYERITNSTSNPTHMIDTVETQRQMNSKLIKFKIESGKLFIVSMGLHEQKDLSYMLWGENTVPVYSEGSWSEKEVSEYIVVPLGDRSTALVVWFDKNDDPKMVIVEGRYLDFPKYFNPYWDTHNIKVRS